jgi:hypothetical protein
MWYVFPIRTRRAAVDVVRAHKKIYHQGFLWVDRGTPKTVQGMSTMQWAQLWGRGRAHGRAFTLRILAAFSISLRKFSIPPEIISQMASRLKISPSVAYEVLRAS